MVSDNLDLTPEQLKRQRNNDAGARYRESREHAREWRNRKIANGTPEEVAALRAAESAKTKRNQDRCRDEVYGAYGGYKCNCCNETERMFLSIDHMDNNGAEERRSGKYNGGGSAFYNWLRKNNFPEGYQVLCMNCQVGKHRNGGVCPHQTTLTL